MSMKKIFALSLVSITCFVWLFASADNNIIGNTGNTTRQMNAWVTIPDQWLLQYITLGFCNEQLTGATKQNIMKIRPWQTKEICMVFHNSSSGDSVNLALSFVDTEISNQGNMVCSLGIKTGNSLASLISFDAADYNITVPPQGQIIKKAKIHVPQNMSWLLYGCVGYNLDIKRADNYTGVFFVIRRSVGLMEVNITWSVYKYGWRDNIVYTYKDNQSLILNLIAAIIGIILVYYIVVTTKAWKQSTHKPSEKKANKK